LLVSVAQPELTLPTEIKALFLEEAAAGRWINAKQMVGDGCVAGRPLLVDKLRDRVSGTQGSGRSGDGCGGGGWLICHG
jgi:hypothetical protein